MQSSILILSKLKGLLNLGMKTGSLGVPWDGDDIVCPSPGHVFSAVDVALLLGVEKLLAGLVDAPQQDVHLGISGTEKPAVSAFNMLFHKNLLLPICFPQFP